jgi:hypothetical protein
MRRYNKQQTNKINITMYSLVIAHGYINKHLLYTTLFKYKLLVALLSKQNTTILEKNVKKWYQHTLA